MPLYLQNRPAFPMLFCVALLFCNFGKTVRGFPDSASNYNTTDLVVCVTEAFIPLGHASDRIVGPSNDTYTDSRTGEKINFDEFPVLIAYAVSETEIPLLVDCAQKNKLKAVVRGGGHHFEAYSALNGTLVIDIAHLNHVEVSTDRQTAVVGAGTRLGSLYIALDAYNTSFVGGICPTVSIGGLISAGGFNMNMRALGLSAEHVQSIKAMTVSKEIIIASENSHADLFWAMLGGGGGTYAISLEYTLKLTALPNSAMVYLNWAGYNDTTAFEVSRRFLQWAPLADRHFTSQINVYNKNVEIIGWYLGKTQAELQELMNVSGLLHIRPQYLLNVSISGDCDTDASRLFGSPGGLFTCTPDPPPIAFLMNATPDPFTPIPGYKQYQYNETTSAPQVMSAPAWPRIRRIAKSFIVQKDNLLQDEVLKQLVSRIEKLDDASQVCGEWHAWNLPAVEGHGDSFAWREQAYAHLEFRIHGSENVVQNQVYLNWMSDLESYLRPKVGQASYTGYADQGISTNPYTSYFGDNVCRLVGIKKTYDPNNFLTNPLAIPPVVPKGVEC